MNVKQLREFLANVSDETPIYLIDISTDDPDKTVYHLNHKTDIALTAVNTNLVKEQYPTDNAIIITFYNLLNENGI